MQRCWRNARTNAYSWLTSTWMAKFFSYTHIYWNNRFYHLYFCTSTQVCTGPLTPEIFIQHQKEGCSIYTITDNLVLRNGLHLTAFPVYHVVLRKIKPSTSISQFRQYDNILRSITRQLLPSGDRQNLNTSMMYWAVSFSLTPPVKATFHETLFPRTTSKRPSEFNPSLNLDGVNTFNMHLLMYIMLGYVVLYVVELAKKQCPYSGL